MFANVLIANRGEIACRIIATARRLGLRTLALATPADRGALFTRLADETYEIGVGARRLPRRRRNRRAGAARSARKPFIPATAS